jgi:hypothetical protein
MGLRWKFMVVRRWLMVIRWRWLQQWWRLQRRRGQFRWRRRIGELVT